MRCTAAAPRIPTGHPPPSGTATAAAATLSEKPGRLGHWGSGTWDTVPTTSALSAPTPPARTHLIGGLRHGDLLTHDTVYAQLLDWLRT